MNYLETNSKFPIPSSQAVYPNSQFLSLRYASADKAIPNLPAGRQVPNSSKLLLFLLLILVSNFNASAQFLGGSSVYNFLKLSNSPQVTALGGVHISGDSPDIGLAYNNPGLLKPSMHSQVNAVFNDFHAGIKVFNLAMGYHHEQTGTMLSGGIQYLDYGSVPLTDAAGNVLGNFRPNDWVVQFTAAHHYREKWNGGVTLKYIHSSYGIYKSSGLAVDVGIVFRDSAKLFSAALLVKNLGYQIKPYEGTSRDDLPFDLQLGITKRLAGAPFSFSLTAQQMHRFNILYNDTTFNNEIGIPNSSDKKFSFDNIFRHFVFGTTLHLGDHVEVMAGYNFLRRKELNAGNSGNGINGFSIGAGLLIGKLQVRYARAYYQRNLANNQFGLNIMLNEYMSFGKSGKKAGK